MISLQKYIEQAEEIANLEIIEREADPEQETVFRVDLNSRKIIVPSDFSKQLAVFGEHNAETIWFSIDRYFDGADLLPPAKTVAIEYRNALGEENLLNMDYWQEHGQNTILLGKRIPWDMTRVVGDIDIGIRIYQIKDDSIIYDLGTNPVECYIGPSLHIEESSDLLANPPKDNLNELVSRIESLYSNDTMTNLDYNNINSESLPTLNGVRMKGDLSTNLDTANHNGTTQVKISYNDLFDIPTLNGVAITGHKTSEHFNIKVDTDANLSASSTNPIQNQAVYKAVGSLEDEIDKLWAEMEEMTYIPLSITEFINNVNLAEIGSTVDTVGFSWSLSSIPANLKIEEVALNPTDTYVELTELGLTDTTTFTLTASKKETVTATTDVVFTNQVYYGACGETEYNSIFFSIMNKQLQTTRNATVTVTADAGEYIYYCVPSAYGDCAFTVGGFNGGFTKVATVEYTNTYNTTTYDIWKSDNMGLGTTTLVVL